MRFSLDVIGPDFDNSDLIVFQFSGADLSFRLPDHHGSYNCFLAAQDMTDMSKVSSDAWSQHPLGQKDLRLVKQSWFYDDIESQNHVVLCDFKIELVELAPAEQAQAVHLKPADFEKWLYHHYRLIAVEGVESHLGTEIEALARKEHMMPADMSAIEKLDKDGLVWLTATLGHVSIRDRPDWRTYIPLNESSILTVTCSITIFSSDHDSITIPMPELDQLRKDIRDEILDNISVTYSSAFQERLNQAER